MTKFLPFGWKRVNGGWRPSDHAISPLSVATPPVTAKQLRSFIGSYKQLSKCIDSYAVILAPLEKAAAGKSSGTFIQWDENLLKCFEKAKESLENINTNPSNRFNIMS